MQQALWRVARNVWAGGEAWLSARIMGLRMGTLAGKFLLALFIARFLGLEALGLYGLVQGATLIVPAVVRAGLLGIVSRDLVSQSPVESARTMAHHWAWGLGCYAVLVPVALASAHWFGMGWLLTMAMAVVVLEHLAIDLFYFLMSRQAPLRANMLTFVQSAGWIYPYMLAAWLMPELRDMPALLGAWILGGFWGVGLGICALCNLPWRKVHFRRAWFTQNLSRARLFWISDLSNTAATFADRYLITAFLGLELAGVYILFWQAANAVVTLATSGVMQVYRPRLIAAFDRGDNGLFKNLFRTCVVRTMGGAVLMAVGVAIVMPLLIPFTKQPLAMDYLPLLWVILVGMLARIAADLGGYLLYVRRRDVVFASTNLLALMLALTVNLALLPIYGIYAAAIGLLFVYLGVFGVRVIM